MSEDVPEYKVDNEQAKPEAEIARCNFCGKPRNQVFQLIATESGIAICNECVAECVKIINQKIDETKLPQIRFHG